jgi:hypothetical protein
MLIFHSSFLAIGIGLTFLTLGLTGMLGSDDILACFIVGNGEQAICTVRSNQQLINAQRSLGMDGSLRGHRTK